MTWRRRKVLLVGYYPPPLRGESVHVKQLAKRLTADGVPIQIANLRRGTPLSMAYRTISGCLDFFQAFLKSLGPDTMLHLHTNGRS